MNFRVKIEKLGDQGYFELISIGAAKDIEEAYMKALEKLEENKEKEQEQL